MDKRIIAVDLDGTLAEYHGWKGVTHIGEPIKSVVDAVKAAYEDGAEIHIFTARVSDDESKAASYYISDWCVKHGLHFIRSITATKHKFFTEFWDDRAIQVIKNEGTFVMCPDEIEIPIGVKFEQEFNKASAQIFTPADNYGEVNPVETYNPLDVQEGGDHYKKYKIQPIEFCHANNIPSLESSIIKYVVRHRDKNGLEDLNKAKHTIDILIKLEYNN